MDRKPETGFLYPHLLCASCRSISDPGCLPSPHQCLVWLVGSQTDDFVQWPNNCPSIGEQDAQTHKHRSIYWLLRCVSRHCLPGVGDLIDFSRPSQFTKCFLLDKVKLFETILKRSTNPLVVPHRCPQWQPCWASIAHWAACKVLFLAEVITVSDLQLNSVQNTLLNLCFDVKGHLFYG